MPPCLVWRPERKAPRAVHSESCATGSWPGSGACPPTAPKRSSLAAPGAELTAYSPDPLKPRRVPGRPFPKGVSGNPAGAPRGSRNRATLALDALAEGEASDVLRAMVERAKGGDTAAATLILSRAWPQRKGRPTVLDLPAVKTASDLTAATGALVAAMADGTLTPEEAQAAAAVLQTHRAALETLELEARVAALEAAKEGGR